jgi:5-methylcytosine-specific restriction protein A
LFLRGETYIRKEIHDEFGGQRQSGISTPAKHKAIFIFSSPKGEEFGYFDHWKSDDLFFFYGQGQTGDMEFKRGNKAIRDSVKKSEEIYLFEKQKNGKVKFISKMEYMSHEFVPRPDMHGNIRKAIVFQLRRINY